MVSLSKSDEFFNSINLLQIVVNNAPDLRDPMVRDRVQAMILDMNTTPHSVGMESLQFWMQEMQQYNLFFSLKIHSLFQLL